MQPSYDDFQQNIKTDNSDTFWLVFADYCDENEIGHDIREQINTPYSDRWCYVYTYGVVGEVGGVGGRVGDIVGGGVGSVGAVVGSVGAVVGSGGGNSSVGGNGGRGVMGEQQ